jgi:Na+/melibiose symporter-like transporter
MNQESPIIATRLSQSSAEPRTHDDHLPSKVHPLDNEKHTPMAPDSSSKSLAQLPPTVEEPRDDSDAGSISGQRNVMSSKQLRIAIPALSVCLFVSFIDQTSVSTATPAIAGDLNTGTATSWIGTSFLIASTAFQLINGRLSDIFGRKKLLLICLALVAVGDLGCGFAQTAVQLFILRAIAGIGGGGINSLVMIIVSDITTLQNRGKYQGKFFSNLRLLTL